MEYLVRKDPASKGVAGTALGLSIGAVAYLLFNGGGTNLLGGARSTQWTDREVSLQRQIDTLSSEQQMCVKGSLYLPETSIVFSNTAGTNVTK